MRKQPQKGDFEIAFLKEFDYFQSVAKKADSYLDEHCLDTLSLLVKQNGRCCHGECNQHNILMMVTILQLFVLKKQVWIFK